MAPHSSTLAWKIPWTEEPGRLQSMGSLRVGHDWATSLSLFTFMHWEKEMATHSSVLAWRIPGTGEPGGLPSMGSDRVGHNWSDLAAETQRREFQVWLSLDWSWQDLESSMEELPQNKSYQTSEQTVSYICCEQHIVLQCLYELCPMWFFKYQVSSQIF